METGLLSEERFLVPVGKKIILALFQKIKVGKLLVVFPDGEKAVFGTDNDNSHLQAVMNIPTTIS